LIPKILHYCWFGGRALPGQYHLYFESWEKHLPEFRIQNWSERNFPAQSEYVRQNLAEGNWAFVSDHARFQVLFEQGGIYFDTDVELLQPLSGLEGETLLGFENVLDRVSKNPVGTAIFGFSAGHPLCLEMMNAYDRNPRARPLGPDLLTRIMQRKGLAKLRHHPIEFEFIENEGIRIYHSDILYPDIRGRFASGAQLPAKARAIHHVAGSWDASKLDPLPWWRKVQDYRIDRKILRPFEKTLKKLVGKS
jgi:hypothetical protein